MFSKKNLLLVVILIVTTTLLTADVYQATRAGISDFQFPVNPLHGNRELIPPTNLTATVTDLTNVQLHWDAPTDLIHIFYHDTVPADAYFQDFQTAYGTVFNLSEYPGATLEFIDFRHSAWGLNDSWEYDILIIDFDEGELIESFEGLNTTVNDNWETDIPIGGIPVTNSFGVFIVPLGNISDDAYPVIDVDGAMDGSSYLINSSNYSVVEQAIGDFLIDLWLSPASPTRSVMGENLISVNSNRERNLTTDVLEGYNVYRNDNLLIENLPPENTSYLDTNLDDGSYTYYITAVYPGGESEPSNEATANISGDLSILFEDDFVSYPDFVQEFPPWTTIDLDGSGTYGFNSNTFPGEYAPMSFIIFNPEETDPPLAMTSPNGGKMAASFASTSPPNNDWLIAPRLTLGSESMLSFVARSYTAQYGLERFKVAISTTDAEPGSFSILSEGQFETAPVAWTEFSYDLSEYDNSAVYLAINCVSSDSFVFFLDYFKVTSIGGSDIETEIIGSTFGKVSNYPNPFNPETTISFYLEQDSDVAVDVYDVRGAKVTTITDGFKRAGTHNALWTGKDASGKEVASGVYFYRITTADQVMNGKMLLLK
jgi:hypothetical protein